jgi:nucleoid-associated protein YgaU
MSGTSKAILSISVLLLASLVVYYGMTPPQTSIAEPTQARPNRPTMFGGGGEVQKLVTLGFPPVAADLTPEVAEEQMPVSESVIEEAFEVAIAPMEEVVADAPSPQKIEDRVTKLYTVRDGETLGEIASRELGSYRMWVDIANLNGISDPSRIMPGRTLKMPDSKLNKTTVTTSQSNVPIAQGKHRVEEGETLSSIAIDYYDEANKYSLIVTANPGIDPDRLQIGDVLIIPSK